METKVIYRALQAENHEIRVLGLLLFTTNVTYCDPKAFPFHIYLFFYIKVAFCSNLGYPYVSNI